MWKASTISTQCSIRFSSQVFSQGPSGINRKVWFNKLMLTLELNNFTKYTQVAIDTHMIPCGKLRSILFIHIYSFDFCVHLCHTAASHSIILLCLAFQDHQAARGAEWNRYWQPLVSDGKLSGDSKEEGGVCGVVYATFLYPPPLHPVSDKKWSYWWVKTRRVDPSLQCHLYFQRRTARDRRRDT